VARDHFTTQQNNAGFDPTGGRCQMDIRSTLRQYIAKEIMHEPDPDKLADDAPLIEGGIIDSMNLIALVAFMKESFGVEIGENDLDIENFQSLNALTKFIAKKNLG
jgi:acyl carrier protein